ncbi:MAG: VWA domain-containing protein [Candidatus Nitrosocosmicus sp.]
MQQQDKSSSSSLSTSGRREFVYFPISLENKDDDEKENKKKSEHKQQDLDELKNQVKSSGNDLLKRFFPDILKALGDKAIKENTLSLRELEQHLQNHIQDLIEKNNYNSDFIDQYQKLIHDQNKYNKNFSSSSSSGGGSSQQQQPYQLRQQDNFRLNFNFNNNLSSQSSSSSSEVSDLPIVSRLMERGYLVDSKNWLKKKGFLRVGQEILSEIIKSLKADKLGMHEENFKGSGGNVVEETSRRYEFGNDLSNINVNSTIMNIIERKIKKQNHKSESSPLMSPTSPSFSSIEFPLDIDYEDLEIYDTTEEIQVATVYCIDLSSTMKYSSMYNDLSRIEAAKRALWSLYILNKRFFPLDTIFVLGFGSVASKISTFDIPFLKTFETNADFLHYTNYQSAYRLAKKMLKKTAAKNKRIVMITDGHPSACFIDSKNEKEKIMKQRPYSHFYLPDYKTLYKQYSNNNNIKLEIKEKQIVYLCYRYRQIDQYIGEQTIKEAKNTYKTGISIDTIMVSEDDTLLDFINELAKSVNGKSIYINPKDIDKVLIKDYLVNKKKTIKKK